jgi:hypothetical protein
MDLHSQFIPVLLLFVVTLLLNLPCGYARAKSKRYSFRWFLWIHIPIPFIFIARTLLHVEFKYLPLFVIAAITGQLVGGKRGS